MVAIPKKKANPNGTWTFLHETHHSRNGIEMIYSVSKHSYKATDAYSG